MILVDGKGLMTMISMPFNMNYAQFDFTFRLLKAVFSILKENNNAQLDIAGYFMA